MKVEVGVSKGALRGLSLIGLNGGLSISSIILAFSLSWLVLAQMDFLYPVFHDHTGIEQGIEKFAPKNRYKQGFEHTSAEQRYRLFAEINKAIHSHGNGLAQITYTVEVGGAEHALLRKPEVQHLQDVANLLDFLKWLIAINIIVWAGFTAYGIVRSKSSLSWRYQLVGLGGFCSLAVLILLIAGPENVFNQLHIWVFPKEHQWFFYYQESLMSTMMMAPDLFAWIALSLAALALLIYSLLTHCIIFVSRRFHK